jgi:tellurite resistance protein TerC
VPHPHWIENVHPISVWVGFNAFILAMLALDLGVFHRRAHTVRVREAAGWSIFWVALSLIFNYGVFRFLGPQAGLEFLTGYLIEKALSVDNLFVFVLIFQYFRVPRELHHRVLFWGILGALVMRGLLITIGAILIARFHWILYVFGAFLAFTGVRLAIQEDQTVEPERNPLVRLVRRFLPVTAAYRGERFFVSEDSSETGRKRWMATPLFLVLLAVETTDLIFAVDSIPAIFAVTQDAFLVYTSNAFAILGLRALYSLLAGLILKFRYLRPGLAAILIFVGAKMLVADVYRIPTTVALGVVVGILAVSAVASLTLGRKVSG